MADKHAKAPGFMVYRDAALFFTLLPDDAAAAVIKAACEYFLSGATPIGLEGKTLAVFEEVRSSIDRNSAKYAETVENNRAKALKRWSKK